MLLIYDLRVCVKINHVFNIQINYALSLIYFLSIGSSIIETSGN